MRKKYWLIEMSERVRQRISNEQLELATVVQREGQEYLLYRDSFVAHKAASLLGVELLCLDEGAVVR